jgi:hypothetical protein
VDRFGSAVGRAVVEAEASRLATSREEAARMERISANPDFLGNQVRVATPTTNDDPIRYH